MKMMARTFPKAAARTECRRVAKELSVVPGTW